MKLRTTHNSIRIRIRKSELVTLQEHGVIVESIQFPNGLLRFSLEVSESQDEVKAKFEDGHVQVLISQPIADQWMTSQQVGIEREIALDNGESLHVLIEKDFPCLDRQEEDKSDTFWELAPETPESC